MSVEINLNDFVRVKLNDYGKEIFYHQFDELNKKSGREVIKRAVKPLPLGMGI